MIGGSEWRIERKQRPIKSSAHGRLLMFVEQEIARQGGSPVTLYADQFALVGWVKVVRPA
jgi:hypothetical protein